MTVDWSASWVWNGLPEAAENVYLEARKSFHLDKVPVEACLSISANQSYIAYINGVQIGRGPAPADADWKYYDEYDVSAYLKPGVNVLAVVAYNFGSRDIVTEQFQGPGGLIAQLDAVGKDGKWSIGTDGSWRCRRSPRWVAHVSRLHKWNGFREIYLAEKEDGWEQASYDDSAWELARVVSPAGGKEARWPRLLPAEIAKLSVEHVHPVGIVRTDMNYGRIAGQAAWLSDRGFRDHPLRIDAGVPGSLPGVVYDFGREIVGYLHLTVDAPAGGVLQLSFGESLEMQLGNTFIMKPGTNELHTYSRRAFRYLQISAMATPEPITVASAETEFTHYPFGPGGSFACSDPLLEQIWETGVYTTKVNSQHHIEDCPLREQALWVVDAVVIGKVIYHVYGDTDLMRKCLIQSARIQNPDGSIPGTGPERNGHMLPDFCAHWLFGVHTHWKYTGDKSFIEEMWPHIERLLDWFRAQEDEDGLFARADRSGWWCFIDWADYLDRRDRVTAVNCFYYKSIQLAADIADAVGEPGSADSLRQRAVRLRKAIREKLRFPGSPAFADCRTGDGLSDRLSAQSNFAAIWSGVMEEEEAERFLQDIYFQNQTPPLKGSFFYHIVLETLLSRSRSAEALDIIRSYWGDMLARGATTWWETFDPSLPACTVPSPYQGHTPTYLRDDVPVSFCHGWGASPTYLLTQYVLGVDIWELGSGGKLQLQAPVDGLDWANGEIPTAQGVIRISWHRESDGVIAYKAEIPEGLQPSIQQEDNIRYTVNGALV